MWCVLTSSLHVFIIFLVTANIRIWFEKKSKMFNSTCNSTVTRNTWISSPHWIQLILTNCEKYLAVKNNYVKYHFHIKSIFPDIYVFLFFLAQTLVQSLNTSVDPCEDFYRFACGGWIAKHPVPPTKSHWNQFDVIAYELDRHLKGRCRSDLKLKIM